MNRKPSYINFNKAAYAWKPDIDYRKNPELYRVGKGEQGVLICEPYKSEIVQFWRFKTEEIARKSSEAIYQQFLSYIVQDEFVGADMARKFLQMGYTRARRYANYKGGKKYDKDNDYRQFDIGTGESEKAKAALVFYEKWKLAEANAAYKTAKINWKKRKGLMLSAWSPALLQARKRRLKIFILKRCTSVREKNEMCIFYPIKLSRLSRVIVS